MPIEIEVGLRTRCQSDEVSPKVSASHCAEHVVADVGDDAMADIERPQRQRRVAGRPAGPQLRMVDEGLGAGPRPWRDRPHDQVDGDAADHMDRRLHRPAARTAFVMMPPV